MTTTPPSELAGFTAAQLRKLEELAIASPESLPGDLSRVCTTSEFVVHSCTRNPLLLDELLDSGDLTRDLNAQDYRARVVAALETVATEDELGTALRQLKRRELVRIAWRDISGLADFDTTVGETSAFADAVLDLTLARLYEWQTAQRGVPSSADGEPQRMVVLALGKLGASELNFSSDIDLIFTFPESGQTVGSARALDNEEFFIRLARRYINVLSQTTAEGFVFRVDMRLRPFGSSGRLVCSVSAMEDYYQIHGRDWERYALIRARPVAGDIKAGEILLEQLRPFVFRRYIDFGALESLRDMKAMVSAEVSRKSMEDNIKLGPGGIREVEFIGQAFQLVRGGRVSELRDRRILTVLAELGQLEYLPAYAVQDLSEAYQFLRTTEHRLQQFDEQQTHTLPSQPLERARLAYGLGYTDWATFSARLEKHRARVQSHFEQVFQTSEEDTGQSDSLLAVWEGSLNEAQVHEALSQSGFEDPAAVAEVLKGLRSAYSVKGLEERGRARLGRLVPALLRTLTTRSDPLTTLKRVVGVVEAIARRSVYLALLVERPLALSQLVKLCEASPLVARQFARYPLLLDELLDPRSLYAPLDCKALSSDLDNRLSSITDTDVEQEMDALRQFKQSNVLRVAAADLTHAIDIDAVSERLTQIAEVALAGCLKLAWRDVCARYGEPYCEVDGKRERAPFCIVAYGKFGGKELSYGSDLDLVFLHDSRGASQSTDGAKAVDNTVFFPRLAQRTIHYLSTHTAAGNLYTVDARLRPSGSGGLLVTGLDSFEQYQQEQAWTWEHQALVRARIVAGDPAIKQRFEATRVRLLLRDRDTDVLRREVRDMRARMQRELGSSSADQFDIKQDRGGIADIEFMVQYGALAWAQKLRKHLHLTDNLRLLDVMAELGLLPREDADCLADAYREYRALVHRLALAEQPAVVSADELEPVRTAVSTIWQRLMED